MKWQDIIISVSYVFFNVALIPTVLMKNKPRFETSIVTGSINIILAITQLSLNLYLSFAMTLFNAVLWLFLAYQARFQLLKRTHQRKK